MDMPKGDQKMSIDRVRFNNPGLLYKSSSQPNNIKN